MNLHLGAPVTEPASGLRDAAGRIAEEPPVELGRCDVRDHGAGGLDSLAVGQAHPGRPAVTDEDRLDLGARTAGAAVVLDQANERFGELCASAFRYGHPALLDRDRDHLGHEPGGRGVRPETGVEHPGCEQPVRAFGGERVLEPVPARDEHVSGELGQAAAPEAPGRLRGERGACSRPELGAEKAEREVGIRQKAVEGFPPGCSVALRVPIQLRGVGIGRSQQEGGLSVREDACLSEGRCSGTRGRVR